MSVESMVKPGVKPESLLIDSLGGFKIRILHYAPVQPTSSSLPACIVLPATGVQASFYDAFCSHLATQGLGVVSVDYRFIGSSLPEGVRRENREQFAETLRSNPNVKIDIHYKADTEHALRWLIRKYPARPIVAACHSVGGHLVTLIDPALSKHVQRVLYFGVFFPSYCYSGFEEAKRAGCADILRKCDDLGYFDSRSVGLGSDLPAGIGKQWFGWMEHANYFAHDHKRHLLKFKAPILSLVTKDDVMMEGSTKGPDANLGVLSCPATRVQFNPERLGWPEIGHIDIFKATYADSALWRIMTLWLRDGIVDVSRSKEKAAIRHFRGGVMQIAKTKL